MLQEHVTDASPTTATPIPRNWRIGRRVHLHLPSIPLRHSERWLLLGMMDVLVVNAAFLGALILRSDSATMGLVSGMQLRWFVLLSAVWTVVAITPFHTIHGELFQAIPDCRELGIPITTMASLHERITGRVPVEHAGRDLTVVLPIDESPIHRLYLALKRLIDIGAGVVGCTVVALLSPLVWLTNQLTDAERGDLFYRQERVGKGGKIFKIVKYRTMVMDAEKHTGAVWASENDERVTGVGRFLRKTRLDELPQFWNVLRGEMSLVGPRPERPEMVCHLVQEIPSYLVRHAVQPGITGWAQVKYRYAASVDDTLLKLQYDLYYIKHQGLYLDVYILLKTAQVMLGLKGR